jgi:Tol biopolymer transport system component/DNA-binding winged helix-turn-helix (wHTH) protein
LTEKRFYKFGDFSLEARAKVLLRGDRPVRLALKCVETLLVLIENAGQVVTKDEIMQAVWPDRVVGEANLMQNIAVIRRTLAAEPGSPAYVETFPGRGYRLVGPVVIENRAAHPVAVRPAPLRWRRWLLAGPVVAVLVAIGWFVSHRQSLPVKQGFRILPLTRLPGKEYQPAVSADGGKVAFVWAREGNQPGGIWLQETGGGLPPRAVTRRDGHYSSPTWAPDGGSLAYLRVDRSATEVVITSLDSGEDRLVSRLVPGNYGFDNRMLAWSGDGRRMVVAHSASAGKPAGLVAIDVATGERRDLTAPADLVGGDFEPRISPDRRTVSFIRYINRTHQELFVVPMDGGEPRPLTADGKRVSGQDWMPDGKSIVFASDRGGEFRLWKIRADAPNPARTLIPTGIYAVFPIQLSLASRAPALVYSVLLQDRNIWRLDLKEKTWLRLIASSGLDASPQYSPAGDRICFRSDRSGEEQLWVTQADGSNPVQVTRGSVQPSVGRWSPDGRAIVFNDHKTSEIFVAQFDAGGAWTVRSLGAKGVHPVYSADGKWIYAGAAASIVRIPAGGGAAGEAVAVRGLSLGLSPDGGFLYFVRDPNDTQLWRASTITGEYTRVLDGLVPVCTSCWAPARTGIYYLGSNPRLLDAQTLYFLSFAGGRRLPVIDYPEPLSPLGSGPFSLSPDGRYLLCVRVDPSNVDVMRVEGFE